MGKKSQNKYQKNGKHQLQISAQKTKEGIVKLSPQKKSELTKYVDKLLRVTSSLGQANLKKSCEIHLEVEKLLQKITSFEDEINVGLPERSNETIDNLTAWMLENDAKIQGVELAEFDDYGYGLKANQDLKEGAFLISVPRKLMMTTELARKSELQHLIRQDALLMHMPNIMLALFLLLEKAKPNSFWEPYIKALPSSYTTVMYFTIDALNALKGSPIHEPALKQCRSIARQYAYLYHLFQKSTDPASETLRDVFTYKQYRWAVSTVMTRQNLIPTDRPENPMILALIPYWDMGNHDNAKLTTDYNLEVDQSEYYSCRDFKAGEQVFMWYGARPNADVFLHNGFVQMNNASDGIRLKLGVSRSDPLCQDRVALLSEIAVQSTGEFLLGPGPIDPKLLAFLRVFSMNKEHLDEWNLAADKFELLQPSCSLDVAVEKKMWRFIIARMELLSASYPDSIQEDEKILNERTDLDPYMRLAVQQRLTEKRILKKALTYAVETEAKLG